MARKRNRYKAAPYKRRQRRKQFSKAERLAIFERDGYTCQLCRKDLRELPEDRILDHIIPLSKCGSNGQHNIWLLCNECDKRKHSSVIPQALDVRLQELYKKKPWLKKKGRK